MSPCGVCRPGSRKTRTKPCVCVCVCSESVEGKLDREEHKLGWDEPRHRDVGGDTGSMCSQASQALVPHTVFACILAFVSCGQVLRASVGSQSGQQQRVHSKNLSDRSGGGAAQEVMIQRKQTWQQPLQSRLPIDRLITPRTPRSGLGVRIGTESHHPPACRRRRPEAATLCCTARLRRLQVVGH